MAYRLGIRVYDFGSPDCITGVSSELVVRLYLLCAYLVVVPTAVHLPLEGLVVCIIYYLPLIYPLPSGAARRHLYCLSLRTGRLFDRFTTVYSQSSNNLCMHVDCSVLPGPPPPASTKS